MSHNLFKDPIRGIITPLLTPLDSNGIVDFPAFEKLVNHVVDGGVDGVFVLGTTGEGPCLNLSQRFEIIKAAKQFVSGKVPVLVGVTDTVYDTSVRLSHFSQEMGVDALVMTPPPYFSSSQDELLGHFKTLSSVSELPCYLYNIPSLTKTVIEPETIVEASKLPRIVGVKDSSGDLAYFKKVRQATKELDGISLYMGPEEYLVEAIGVGADGGVHGGSNLFPHLYTSLYQAAVEGQKERVEELSRIVLNIGSQLYALSQFENLCIRVVKFLLSRFGICGETMVPPYLGLSAESKRLAEIRLEEILSELEKAGIPVPSLPAAKC